MMKTSPPGGLLEGPVWIGGGVHRSERVKRRLVPTPCLCSSSGKAPAKGKGR